MSLKLRFMHVYSTLFMPFEICDIGARVICMYNVYVSIFFWYLPAVVAALGVNHDSHLFGGYV